MHSTSSGSYERENDAPEVDHAPLAPQHYPITNGLIVSPVDGLNLNRETGNLEQVARPNNHPPYAISTPPSSSGKQQQKNRKQILIMLATCIAIVAIALGVGIGFGLRRDVDTGTGTSPTVSTAPSPSNTPINPSTDGIMSDTSVSAVLTGDNNKHLFFQDVNGSLRHTFWANSNNSWSIEADFLSVSSQPQNNTPIGVIPIVASGEGHAEDVSVIHVFFLSEEGFLTATTYSLSPSGPTNPITSNPTPMNASFSVAKGSRLLAVDRIPMTDATALGQAALFYEDPNGMLTTLIGTANFSVTDWSLQWTWQNFTDVMFSSIGSMLNVTSHDLRDWIEPPMNFARSDSNDTSCAGCISLSFFNNHDSKVWNVQFSNWSDYGAPWTGGLSGAASLANATSVRESDIISYFGEEWNNGSTVGSQNSTAKSVWVENGSLNFVPPPSTPFPYSRVARLATPSSSGTIFIYHQLSAGVLVEDAYSADTGWRSTNITIGASP